MDTREAYTALNLIPGLGPVRLTRLLETFEDPVKVLSARRAELERVRGFGPQMVTQILEWEKHTDLEGELRRVEEFGARIVTREDEEYPQALRQIYDPPVVLYVWGRLEPADRHGIGIVGSRRVTPYGSECARRFSYSLAKAGMTIISGLALGIDTEAHKAAVAAEGRTIAVIGSGLTQLYPPENRELAERIANGCGAVISELPIGMRPDRTTFPMRNRIISGMAEGVLVVEAGLKSGAIITANQAAEQGRTTFAIPGPIDRPHSEGCHELIRNGARLVTQPGDVLAELQELFPASLPRDRAGPVKFSADSQSYERVTRKPLPPLNAEEKLVHNFLEQNGGSQLDELVEGTGISSALLASVLLGLEMKKVIRQLPGNQIVLA